MAPLPDGSEAVTGPVTASDGRPGPWYRQIDWSSTFWTIFLLIPLSFVIREDMPLSYKVVGVTGLLGFTCAYTWAVSTMPLWLDLPEGAGVVDQLRPAAGRLALLAGIAAASAPGLNGWYTSSYLPYFCAIVLFATTLRTGLIISGCLILLTDLGILLLAPEAGVTWAAMGFSLSSIIVMLSRFGADASARREAEGRELAAAAEREEIGRDVHDLLGHSLTVLTLKAEVAHRLVRRDPEAAEHELAEIVELSRSALADVRATVTRLRVPDLAGQLEASRTAFAAADIAAALIAIVRRHTPDQLAECAGIYHYCGSPYASWFEFAETIFAEAAAQGVLAKIPTVKPIATADYPTPAKRPADSRLDCGKIRTVFGIGPCDWHSALSDLRPYL